MVDDSKAETTLILQYGEQQKSVVITDANRELMAYGGWQGWVQFVEELPSTPTAEP